MRTNPSHEIVVHDADDHVEVSGLSLREVEAAIELFRGVDRKRAAARASLSSLVDRAMLDNAIPLVSAASQRQVQRSAELRRHLLEVEGAETYASLAGLRGGRESSARTWVSRPRTSGRIFTVEVQGRTLIPKVQLTATGRERPEILELALPLQQAGLDGWSLWAWLTSPTGLLSGEIPADVVRTDLGRAHRAAIRYAAELRRARDSAPEASASDEVRPLRTALADGAE